MAYSNQNGKEYRGDLEFRVNEALMRYGVSEDSLEHHGIKGQKWGVIRTPEQLGHEPQGGKDYKAQDGKDPNAAAKRARREAVEKAVQGAKRVAKKVSRTIKRKVKKAQKESAEKAELKRQEKQQKREIASQARVAAKAQKSQKKLEREARHGEAKLAREKARKEARDAKAQEEYEKRRAKDLATPQLIYKNRHKYSQEELRDAMNMIKFEADIRDLKYDSVKRAKDKVKNVVELCTSTADAYNVFAGLYNSFRPDDAKPLPQIAIKKATGGQQQKKQTDT